MAVQQPITALQRQPQGSTSLSETTPQTRIPSQPIPQAYHSPVSAQSPAHVGANACLATSQHQGTSPSRHISVEPQIAATAVATSTPECTIHQPLPLPASKFSVYSREYQDPAHANAQPQSFLAPTPTAPDAATSLSSLISPYPRTSATPSPPVARTQHHVSDHRFSPYPTPQNTPQATPPDNALNPQRQSYRRPPVSSLDSNELRARQAFLDESEADRQIFLDFMKKEHYGFLSAER